MTNKQRILDISKNLGLSHIGSNLSCLPVLEEIYKAKEPEDIVILDNAHAHLAHLVVREFRENLAGWNAEELIDAYGIHCDREAYCDASGGSLGHGLGIAIGYALADRDRDVYVIVSEGSMMEGSSWEALRTIADLQLDNIKIYTNFNGYSAVAEIDTNHLQERMRMFLPEKINFRLTKNGEGFEGLAGHYKKI